MGKYGYTSSGTEKRADGTPINFGGNYDAYQKYLDSAEERKQFNTDNYEQRYNAQMNGGGYDTYGGGYNSGGGGGGYNNAMEKAKRLAKEARAIATANAVAKLNGQIPDINKRAEEAARQAHIYKEQARINMPQQLAATGLSGGMTDSAILGMNANYQNNISGVVSDRDNAIKEVNQNISDVRAGGDLAVAEIDNQYTMQLAEKAMEEEQRQREIKDQMNMKQLDYDLKVNGSAPKTGGSGGKTSSKPKNEKTGQSPYIQDEVTILLADPRSSSHVWLQDQQKHLTPEQREKVKKAMRFKYTG